MSDLGDMRRSYERASLAEEELAPTWHEQLERWLADAIDSGAVTEPNAMVLATADSDAAPSARTVLCKGLDERGVVFYTNLSSRKGQELHANPHATALFPWVSIQRQAIVEGEVVALTGEESDAYFASRPHGSRISALVSPQSRPIASREEIEAAYARAEAEHPEDVPRPADWGGLRIVPHTVEFWQGRADRLHDRLRFRHTAGEWVVERLAP